MTCMWRSDMEWGISRVRELTLGAVTMLVDLGEDGGTDQGGGGDVLPFVQGPYR